MVQSNGLGTGPAHLPVSTVATGLPFGRRLPGLRTRTCSTLPAMVWEMSVMPTDAVPSLSGRTQIWNSAS
jgi:hypothetical protein